MSDEAKLPDDYYVVDSDNVQDRVIRKVGDKAYYVTSQGVLEVFEVSILRNFRPVVEEATAWRAVRQAFIDADRTSFLSETTHIQVYRAVKKQIARLNQLSSTSQEGSRERV